MLSTLTAFQERITKILVERVLRRWLVVEGVDDDFDIQFNAQQIILNNLTLKEIHLNNELSIGGWCEEAVIEIDWSGLWRYWQTSASETRHLLLLRQCTLLLTDTCTGQEEEEFFDAVSWDSFEELEEEFSEQQPQRKEPGVFGDWIDGMIGQVRIEIEGLSVEKKIAGEPVELTLERAVIESVRSESGARSVNIEEAAVLRSGKQMLRAESITGSLQGNQKETLQLQCDKCVVDFDGFEGEGREIYASMNEISVASVMIDGLLQVKEIRVAEGALTATSIEYLREGGIGEDTFSKGYSLPSSINLIPLQVSVDSFKWKDFEASSITGTWPHFQVSSVKGNFFSARDIDIMIDLSKQSLNVLFCGEQKRFIDNLPVMVISEDVPEAAVTVSVGSLEACFDSLDSIGAKEKTSFKLPCSVQLHVASAQVNGTQFNAHLTYSIITLLPDASIDARISKISGSATHCEILDGCIRAVLIGNHLTVEADGMNANVSVDSPDANNASNLPPFSVNEILSLLACSIDSVLLTGAALHVTLPKLPQSISLALNSLYLFPSRSTLYSDSLRASTPSMSLDWGMLKATFESIECDELVIKMLDVKEATEFFIKVQELINPPVPVSEPSIKWYKEAIVEAEAEEEEFDSDASDRSSDEKDSYPAASIPDPTVSNQSITADNLDLEALKDALSSTCLPSPAADPSKFKVDLKSISITCNPFSFACSVALNYTASAAWHVTLNALKLTHSSTDHPILTKWPRGPLKDPTTFGSSFSDASIAISPWESEYNMDVYLCPLRIKINAQVLSDFLELQSRVNSLQSSTNQQLQPSNNEFTTPVAFFATVKVAPLAVKLDFFPTLQGAHVLLPPANLTGIPGVAGLCSALYRRWLPSLKSRAQVNRMLRSGVTPVRMSMRLGEGVVELIMLPGYLGAQSAARSADDARRAARKVAGEMIKGTAGVVEKIILVMGGAEEIPKPIAMISKNLQLMLD